MSTITSFFSRARRKALIPYITVGYPSLEATLEAVPALEAAGSDIVELGIPFSDPLADGATIQQASYLALKQGITPERCLEVARELRRRVELPLVFMSYYNPIRAFGVEAFCAACARSRVDGLIIPDLPPEEGAELEAIAQKYELDLIYLLAPTSTEERISLVASRSKGFVYLVSVAGVTWARDILPPELEGFVARVRQRTDKPLCVGFGISTPEQARRVARVADGVIVGSRLIQLMAEPDSMARLRSFVGSLRQALG